MAAGMVIVGAGHAGTSAAMTLRAEGYDGPVTLVGGEAFHPYERPPLSKGVMLSDDGRPGVGVEGWEIDPEETTLRGQVLAASAAGLAEKL